MTAMDHIMPAARPLLAQPLLPRPRLPLWQMPELTDGSRPPSTPALAEEENIDDSDNRNGINGSATPPSDDALDGRAIAEVLQDQCAQGYAEGWEQGRLEGAEKGYADAIAAAAAAQTALAQDGRRLAAIAARLGASIPALDAAVEEAVAALALEVARCVIGSEVSRSRDYLVRLIREALAKVPLELGAVAIIVNPADRDLICRLAPDITDGNAVLVADDAVEPGDCRVIADSQTAPAKDLRWRPRATEGIAQVNLSLASRWRAAMLALFEDEDK
jgi:flagellar biosynthesis/type III secretory pathway protein FliH